MVGSLLVLFVFAIALLAPILLYVLVRAEHDQWEQLDRADAERAARRDTSEER